MAVVFRSCWVQNRSFFLGTLDRSHFASGTLASFTGLSRYSGLSLSQKSTVLELDQLSYCGDHTLGGITGSIRLPMPSCSSCFAREFREAVSRHVIGGGCPGRERSLP